jgi:membrane protein
MARARATVAGVARLLIEAFERNNILTYASAIAFQVLIALVALVLLGLSLVHVLGVESVWTQHILPFVYARFSFETYLAVDTTVARIFTEQSVPLLVFAAVLAVWEVSGSIRAMMGALNQIYGLEEKRATWRRFSVSFTLAVAVGAAVLGAVLAVTLRGAWPSAVPRAVVFVLGWGVAVGLLLLAVWLLLRLAPAERRPTRWATAGSFVVIIAWIVASVGFRYYVVRVADYKSALGNLVAVLTVTSYLYTSAIVFLVGAQIDEFLRRGAIGDERILTLLPRVVRRRTTSR